jgi:hypothetical protein
VRNMANEDYYLTPGPPPEWPGKVAAWLKRAAASFRGSPERDNMLHPDYYGGPPEPAPEPERARPKRVEPGVPDRETLHDIFDWPAMRLAALRPFFRR